MSFRVYAEANDTELCSSPPSTEANQRSYATTRDDLMME